MVFEVNLDFTSKLVYRSMLSLTISLRAMTISIESMLEIRKIKLLKTEKTHGKALT